MTTPSQPLHGKRGYLWWTGRILLSVSMLLAALIGLVFATGASARAKLKAKYPPSGQMVDLGGYKLHLYCQGAGSPTVVMESGLGDFSLIWALVQPEVAQSTRICAYDRAGFGWSESSPRPRTAENIVEELHALLQQADIASPYVLVGHSMGGVYVRLYAHKYPDEVTGMVLVDSSHEEQDFARRMP
jgi:pimeloyl-ACP methyl ester carboxylesterase